MKQLKDVELPLSVAEQARLNAAAKAWLERRDPVAKELTTAPEDNTSAEKKEVTSRFRQRIAEHNAELIRREWEAAGLQPQPYSLELAKLLNPKPTAEGQGEEAA